MLCKRLFVTLACLSIGCNSSSNKSAGTPKLENTKEPVATVEGNVALDFSPDGKWLAVGAELIDTSTWKVVAKLEERISEKNPASKNHWGYTSVAFSPDSNKLALGDQDGSLRILEIPSMNVLYEGLAHGARPTGIGFASDNETIVTSSVDDVLRLRVWNSRTDEMIFRSADRLKSPQDEKGTMVDVVGAVDFFALSPNRELYAVADVMSKIVIGNVRDGKVLHEFKGPDGDRVEMDSLAFTADSSQLLIAVAPNVYVYNLSGEPSNIQIATKANTEALYVKTINDSGLIAMYYVEAQTDMPIIEFYDLAQSKSLGSFCPHHMRGSYWATSLDGQFIATVGRGGPVSIWNVSEVLKDLTSP